MSEVLPAAQSLRPPHTKRCTGLQEFMDIYVEMNMETDVNWGPLMEVTT